MPSQVRSFEIYCKFEIASLLSELHEVIIVVVALALILPFGSQLAC